MLLTDLEIRVFSCASSIFVPPLYVCNMASFGEYDINKVCVLANIGYINLLMCVIVMRSHS